MLQKKTILVTGATGAQGGSVAKALLQTDGYAVRIFTRRPSSPKALQLQAMGAKVFAGDMQNVTQLEEAMDGCYGVFGVTDYWEHFEQEYSLGLNLIEAVAVSGIQHFVLHTAPDYKALSGGEFSVPQCDIKAALRRFSQELRLPATYLQVPFYYENFLNFFALKKDQYGVFQFGFPQGHAKMAMVSVSDVGAIVAKIFSDSENYVYRTLTAVGADEPCQVYAATMTKVLGMPVHYNHVPLELYGRLGLAGAEELGNMFEVQRRYVGSREADLKESCRINPAMQSFESWLIKNRERFLAHFHYQLAEEAVY